ncbi:MAG TPA: hypothetical protein VHL98_19990 [Microvirga sp.]|jgi:hypothetical protein|nr:hypothetical protein [Microvirga sp.]
MTSLDANALQTDPEGLALLRGVLGTAPAAPPQDKRPGQTSPSEPAKAAMPLTRTTRRLGLIGSTALAGLLIAASPAKPTVPREDSARPAATEMRQEEMRQEAPRETPTPSRPVRAVTKYAAVEADAPACPRVRRKLWVDGEGWIVRSVSRC